MIDVFSHSKTEVLVAATIVDLNHDASLVTASDDELCGCGTTNLSFFLARRCFFSSAFLSFPSHDNVLHN
jgi:hypothetical protein